ncbi:MAG: allophanate hydrolase [Ruminococcus albus]|jgi:allophanate hydrolase|nr:allophanate hydrolase [Ruminococcus albus]
MHFPEKLTVKWVRQAYENGLEPQELIAEIIKRADVCSEYNIWIEKPSMELCGRYIKALPSDRENYPLWGIPFAIKDNIDLADVPTTAACPAYKYIPEKNAFVVNKLIKAGAIPVGKTNLDQFATGLVGTRSPYGEVHNAYQPELISGGSSSGSAVAVALGQAVFALGTDTAGSGRVPAMLNTLVGYKPPVGSWSTSGVVPACASLDCVTVFANTLEEAELVDKSARGYDEECAWSRHFENKGKRLPNKIYLPLEEPQFYGDHKDIYREKWNNALSRIESLGIKIERISYEPFSEAAKILYEGAYVAERWQDLKGFIGKAPGKIFPVTEKILRSGERHTAADLFGDLHRLQKYRHDTEALLQNAVMIMPTAGGTFTREQVRNSPIETNSMMGFYTNHCNLLDLAAVAVPENSTDREYPFGITIFGLSTDECLITAAAERFLGSESMELAVCGLHKHDRELEYQITQLGGQFVRHTITSDEYKLFDLGSKPGMIRTDGYTNSIAVDIYRLPKSCFGRFMENVKMPLCIGDVRLKDGSVVKGFLCEAKGTENANDITDKGEY